ncbi:MAG: AraC family transcriptional regulator [Clostridia bacterium]|nr:AraC family transcriptional regulator [Clostridia bacterium]
MNSNMLCEVLENACIRLVFFDREKHKLNASKTLSFRDFDIWYILSGSVLIDINGKRYTLKPMDAVLMTPGTTAKFYVTEPMEHLYCHFIAEYGKADGLQGSFTDHRIPERQAGMLKEFSDHFQRLLQGDLYAKIVIKSILKVLLCDMILSNPDNQASFFSETAYADLHSLSQITDYIRAHVCEPLVVKELAKMFHFNETYFCRYFLKHLGVSPKQYIAKLKMDHARHLLLNEGLSVKETALRVGFSDSFSFSKQFKRMYRLPPLAFKKLNS